MLPPSKEYAKIIRNRQKGIDPRADKKTAETFKDIMAYEKGYINSPKFLERLTKAGYNAKEYKDNQKDKLDSIQLNIDDSSNNISGAYYSDNPSILGRQRAVNVLSGKEKKIREFLGTESDVIAHEVGHSYDNEKLTPFINKRNKFYPKTEEEVINVKKAQDMVGGPLEYYQMTHEGHEMHPGEMSADVHSARKELYDYTKQKGKKLYDGRYSNFTEDAYNQMKEISAKRANSASSRLLEKISREMTPSEKKVWENTKGIDNAAKQKIYDDKTDAIQENMDKDTKQYIFDIMNRVVDNTDTKKLNGKNIKYAMNGGSIERPFSRKRAIAPLVIGAVLAASSAIAGMSSSANAKKQQKRQLGSQETQTLEGQYMQQALGDRQIFNEFDENGNRDVQYYAKGGSVQNSSQNISPEQMSILKMGMAQTGGKMPSLPISQGGFQTQGGNLVPIGEGVEEAVGNRHNETKIDGVSGIQLHKDGEVQAEIEDKEIVADGTTVYSDRLLYDKNNSYADKMRKLVKKRNKLEERQEKSNDWRVKDTSERQLAGLNMAEFALYQHQEAKKYNEGINVANKLAYGGKIRKFAYGGNPTRPMPIYDWMKKFYQTEDKGKYKGYGKNTLNQYQNPINSDIKINNNSTPMYNYEESTNVTSSPINMNKPGILQKPISPITPDNTLSNILGTAGSLVGSMNSTSSDTSAAASNVVADASNTNKTDWNNILSKVGKYAPTLIDNVGNYIATRNTPQLPPSLLDRAEPLETKVNINPQLAEARRRKRSIGEGILRNTSNSNNAKNNIIAAGLAGERTVDEVLAQKDNQELALRNANSQNRQMVSSKNNATINQDNFRQMQRLNDIQSRDSANLSNLQGDIKNVINTEMLDKQFKTNTLANLADDSLGEKAIIYAQNKEFMNDSSNRDYIYQRAAETNPDGSLKNPKLAEILKKLYN